MGTANQTKEAVEQLNAQPLVDEAWDPDRGYIIAILDRDTDDGSIFQLIDLAKRMAMDGEIRIVTEIIHNGQKHEAIHFESIERVHPPVS